MCLRLPVFSRALGAVILAAALSGCFSNHRSFGDWYWHGGMGDGYGFLAKEERPRMYAHFRLPELLFQPAGGWRYPARTAGYWTGGYSRTRTVEIEGPRGSVEREITESDPGVLHPVRVERGAFGMDFYLFHAGALDVIPYRPIAEDADIDRKLGRSLLGTLLWGVGYPMGLAIRVPYFAIHDVYKILMAPLAAWHYREGGRADRSSRR